MFTFGGINPNSAMNKTKMLSLHPIASVILLDKSNYPAVYKPVVNILADQIYDRNALRVISLWLESHRITKYRILCSIKYDIPSKDVKDKLKSPVIAFYKDNRSNFLEYIQQGEPVITVGAALYSMTCADDVYPAHVTQRIFGVSHFWVSQDQSAKGNWVYPIESFVELFANGWIQPIDSYKVKLAEAQFKSIINGDFAAPEVPVFNKVFIKTPQEWHELVYEANKDKHNCILAWDLETTTLDFWDGKVICITMSFDGKTGYFVPWECVDVDELDELLNNNHQLGANLKFDVEFLQFPRPSNKYVEGHLIIEQDGKKYQIMNNSWVNTNHGKKRGRDLSEDDILTDTNDLKEIAV